MLFFVMPVHALVYKVDPMQVKRLCICKVFSFEVCMLCLSYVLFHCKSLFIGRYGFSYMYFW